MKEKKKKPLELTELNVNGPRRYSGCKPGWEKKNWWIIRRRGKVVQARLLQGGREGGRGGGEEGRWAGGGVMHSSVNEIHHHPSDSFVTFSTGATGRPHNSYTSNQDEPPTARRDTIFSFEMFGKHFSMFYTHTDTHTFIHIHTPTITSVVQRQALCFTSFKLHQTKKQWKLKLR